MGEPNTGNAVLSMSEQIAHEKRTKGIETSQYLEEKKTKVIPKVVASEMGGAQTDLKDRGSRTTMWYQIGQSNDIERSVEEGANPVDESRNGPSGILSTARHVEPCRKHPGPSGKAKYSLMTDSEPVP